jgi:ATP/maltotriose-dependent transcriptional regulator MalT
VREWEERERLSLEELGLSGREAEVVHLVTTGMPNVMIAEELHLAPGTVRKHLDNVYNKLGVRGRGALTAFVLDIAGR